MALVVGLPALCLSHALALLAQCLCTLPSTLIPLISHVIGCTQPLFFLECSNDKTILLGLIDSGAEINLIDAKLLRSMNYQTIHCPIASFRGVQQSESAIQQWVVFQVSLPNGLTLPVKAAVVDNPSNALLLGQPFLVGHGLTLNFKYGLLGTQRGPIKLVTSSSAANISSLVACAVGGELFAIENCVQQSNLSPSQKQQLLELLTAYEHLWYGDRTGRARHVQHRISVTSDHPIRDRPRHYTPDQTAEIKRQVDTMLADGIIKASSSPHSSEVVIVRKKDADGNPTGWRFCIDYRRLNDHTVKDAYPLPRITDLLHDVRDSHHFVALDLRAGYWQIPMSLDSMKYTAFRCMFGLFEYLVMPFGLTNAPATFQRLVDFLFGDLRYSGVLAYLDDILIHGKNFEEVLAKLRVVLDRLSAEGLTINLPKSSFFPSKIKYLGQIIENGRMRPNPAKVEILTKLKEPKTVSDVRRVLGMLGYYQPYIRDFAKLVAPISDTLKDKPNRKRRNQITPVVWTENLQQSVKEAITQLQEAVLTLDLSSNEFMLETDASDYATGAVLSCKQSDGSWAPVEFASKKLSATERRWPTRDKEAFAIMYGLRKFDCYLRGRPITVHTDHKSLKWMLQASEGRIARWASRLTEYEIGRAHV